MNAKPDMDSLITDVLRMGEVLYMVAETPHLDNDYKEVLYWMRDRAREAGYRIWEGHFGKPHPDMRVD